MVRNNNKTIAEELQVIESALSNLTLRVNELRNNVAIDQPVITTALPRSPRSPRQFARSTTTPPTIPKVGDFVSLRIIGVGTVQGTVVGVTAQRIKIDVPGRGIITRAPHNVSVL